MKAALYELTFTVARTIASKDLDIAGYARININLDTPVSLLLAN